MKIAVSNPDEIVRRAERLARPSEKSRSRLFGDSLREYVARHSSEEKTKAMNRASAAVGDTKGPLVSAAARGAVDRQ